MKGLYYLNERISLDNHNCHESFLLQKNAAQQFISENKLKIVKLNQFQIFDYYTILHALLFDLEKLNSQLDFFLLYSEKAIEKFHTQYPERWEQITHHFKNVFLLHEYENSHFKVYSSQIT